MLDASELNARKVICVKRSSMAPVLSKSPISTIAATGLPSFMITTESSR